jgi:hypothetical protein
LTSPRCGERKVVVPAAFGAAIYPPALLFVAFLLFNPRPRTFSSGDDSRAVQSPASLDD